MDLIITPIAAAIAAGAAAGLKDDAARAARDAYAAVKAFLRRKYSTVELDSIEGKPGSSARQAALSEDLAEAGADSDPDLKRLVENLAAVPSVNQVIQTITVTDHGTAHTAGRDMHIHG